MKSVSRHLRGHTQYSPATVHLYSTTAIGGASDMTAKKAMFSRQSADPMSIAHTGKSTKNASTVAAMVVCQISLRYANG
jgi:hypothetical protein